MLLEEALYTYLSTNEGITDTVGDRLFPARLAEGCDLPAISFIRISAARIYTFDPFLATSAWVDARIQFASYGTTALDALKASHAILMAVSGYEGDMSGLYIGSARAVLEIDSYQQQPRLYRRILDVMFSYEDDISGSQLGEEYSMAFSEAFA